MASDCHLCRRVQEIEAGSTTDLVWEFANSVALLGPWQYFHGYCLLVSRPHATELSQLGDGERRAYLEEMCRLAAAIEVCFTPLKLNYELLGNQVGHLHWHLFPRYAADPNRSWPVWLALDRAERDAAEKQRLQMGPRERGVTIEILRKHLETQPHASA